VASLNKFIGIGNLTKDVDTRYLPNGDAVSNFTIAINETWKDKNGAKQERVEFVNIVAFRRLGEICSEFLKKGHSCYIEGKIQTRKYEKDGVTRYATEVIADHMQMLGQPNKDNASGGDSAQSKSYSKAGDPGGFDDMVDDVPF
jgi:single-strand DNA-binding protein